MFSNTHILHICTKKVVCIEYNIIKLCVLLKVFSTTSNHGQAVIDASLI